MNKQKIKPSLINITIGSFNFVGYRDQFAIHKLAGEWVKNKKTGKKIFTNRETLIPVDSNYYPNIEMCLKYMKGQVVHDLSKEDITSLKKLLKIEKQVKVIIEEFTIELSSKIRQLIKDN